MQLNQATDYALRVVLYLSSMPEVVVSGHVIAEQQKIPVKFLHKIMGLLCRADVVSSYRGADGGFKLRYQPDSVTMLQVIEAVEGPFSLNRCLADRDACNRRCADHCIIHRRLGQIQSNFLKSLNQVNFADLVRDQQREVGK